MGVRYWGSCRSRDGVRYRGSCRSRDSLRFWGSFRSRDGVRHRGSRDGIRCGVRDTRATWSMFVELHT